MAKGVQYKKGNTSFDFGSDPGALEYNLLRGTDSMSVGECGAVAKQIMSDVPTTDSIFCYNQTGALGFGVNTGQHIAKCESDCPTMSSTVCYFNTCTLAGKALDGLSTQAGDALDGFTMGTGEGEEGDDDEDNGDVTGEAADVIGEAAGVIGEAI